MGSLSPMDALRKAQEDGVLIGLGGIAGLKPRLDIDELLLNSPDTFNLFILALSELQSFENTGDKMGYFQLAGIHGLPKRMWDDVYSERKGDKKVAAGYCPHGRITFPTWHRSYVALYEQSLYAKMAEIATRYEDDAVRENYLSAVKEFRLPYWDYFRPRRAEKVDQNSFRTGAGYSFNLPLIFTTQEIIVRQTPDNKLVKLSSNPLYRFMCPTKNDGGFDDTDWGHANGRKIYAKRCTVRNPVFRDDDEGDLPGMNNYINSATFRQPNTISIRDRITSNQTYESFATTDETLGASGNLESLHNGYHGALGGGDYNAGYLGWMGQPPTAAFDPVFWIHHCNIERYAAIWQAAHPDSWVKSPAAVKEVAASNLPFRKKRGSQRADDIFWTGSEVRDHTVYGSYFPDAYNPNSPMSAEDVKKRFVYLHDWSVRPGRPGSDFGQIPDERKPLDLSTAQVYNYEGLKDAIVPLEPGPAIGDDAQEALGGAAAEAGEAREEEPPSEPIDDPVPAAPTEEQLRVTTSAAAPGTTAEFAFTNIPADATDVAPPDVDESKYYRDWYIDNRVQRLAFNGPFSIYYFIGPFEGDDGNARYTSQPTLAGQTYIFTSSRELCDNCGHLGDEGQLVTDTSPITPILLDYIGKGLDDLTPDKVVPFLIANLKWRIVSVDGQRQDPRQTPGFQVGISSKLTPRDGDGISGFLYQEFPQVVDKIIELSNQ